MADRGKHEQERKSVSWNTWFHISWCEQEESLYHRYSIHDRGRIDSEYKINIPMKSTFQFSSTAHHPPPPLKKRHTHTFKNKIFKKTTIYSVIFDLCLQELLHSSFSKYGLLYGTQVFPYTPRLQPPSPTLKDGQGASNQTGYYAFVNFYLAMSARWAKDDLNGKVNFKGTECKVCTSNK